MESNIPKDGPVPASSSPSWSVVVVSAMTGAMMASAVIVFHSFRGVGHPSSSSSTTNTLLQRWTQEMQSLEQNLRHKLQQDVVREIHQGMTQTTQQLQKSVVEPVAAAQQQLSTIHRDIGTIKNIFHAPKTRGSWGELQLESIIQNCMPSSNMYEFQHTLSNQKRVDCVLHLPSPIGKLAIDSKFPLDHFRAANYYGEVYDGDMDDARNDKVRKARLNEIMRKHIHDIASKYIVPGETADYAVLFLPSEAVFLQVIDDVPDIIMYANQSRVYIACPTMLMALLAQLHGASRGMALQEQTEDMVALVQKIMEDVDRLVQRFEHCEKSLEKAKQELSKMHVSIGKIRRNKVELDALSGFVAPSTASSNMKNNTKGSKIVDKGAESAIGEPSIDAFLHETTTLLEQTHGINGQEPNALQSTKENEKMTTS
jgi:DNA recombination protein RmuC